MHIYHHAEMKPHKKFWEFLRLLYFSSQNFGTCSIEIKLYFHKVLNIILESSFYDYLIILFKKYMYTHLK